MHLKEKTNIEFINPKTLSIPNGFSHVAKNAAMGLVYISGQVSYDSNGSIVGVGNLDDQVRQVFKNMRVALDSAGSSLDRIMKLTFYVRNLTPERMATIRKVRSEFLQPDSLPASTMIGVSALAKEELELEVEAYAAI